MSPCYEIHPFNYVLEIEGDFCFYIKQHESTSIIRIFSMNYRGAFVYLCSLQMKQVLVGVWSIYNSILFAQCIVSLISFFHHLHYFYIHGE